MENFDLNRITLELTRIKESKDFDCNRGCGEGNPIADQNRVRVWLIYEDRRGAGVGLNSAFIYVLQAEVRTCEPAMSQTRRDSDIVKFSINHLPFVRSFVRSFVPHHFPSFFHRCPPSPRTKRLWDSSGQGSSKNHACAPFCMGMSRRGESCL
jgi:hypothetical protein